MKLLIIVVLVAAYVFCLQALSNKALNQLNNLRQMYNYEFIRAIVE